MTPHPDPEMQRVYERLANLEERLRALEGQDALRPPTASPAEVMREFFGLQRWLVGWFDRDLGRHGRTYVSAKSAEQAKREFENDNPACDVRNVYEVPN